MYVYVLGNKDVDLDNSPFLYLQDLIKDFPEIRFVEISVNSDFPEDAFLERTIFLFDTVRGIKKVSLLDETWIDKLTDMVRSTVHDFDIGFQLKYLKKLGKIDKILIIGLPYGQKVPYSSIHSTFKKLVAQDIQGS